MLDDVTGALETAPTAAQRRQTVSRQRCLSSAITNKVGACTLMLMTLRLTLQARWSSFTAFYPVGTGVMTQGDAVLQAGKVASLIPGIGLSCQEFPCSPRGFLPVTRLHSHSPKTCIVIVWDVTPPLPKGSRDHRGRIDALAVSRQSSYNLHRPCADWWHRIQFKRAPLLSLFRLSWVSRDFFLFLLLNGTKSQTGRSDGKSFEQWFSLQSDCLCNLRPDITKGKKKSCTYWLRNNKKKFWHG